jgi:hypothetical protein
MAMGKKANFIYEPPSVTVGSNKTL